MNEPPSSAATAIETGARNVDHILSGSLLPSLSQDVLTRMATGRPVKSVKVGVGPDENFTYVIE